MKKNDKYDLTNFVPYLLDQAAEVSSTKFQKYYKTKYGLIRTEWRVIFHLGCYGKMTAKEICLHTHSHKTKISRAVASLRKKHCLIQQTMKEDNRCDLLFLTRKGHEIYEDLRTEARKFEQDLLENLTTEERKTFKNYLHKISQSDNQNNFNNSL